MPANWKEFKSTDSNLSTTAGRSSLALHTTRHIVGHAYYEKVLLHSQYAHLLVDHTSSLGLMIVEQHDRLPGVPCTPSAAFTL